MKTTLLSLLLCTSLLQADELAKTMAQAVEEGKIPGLGQIQFTSDAIAKPSFAGTLHVDSKDAPGEGSQWHIGSDAKAMTATLIARLVEKKKLKWDSTMEDLFPGEAKKFHPDARKITITQLLSHTAGLPANVTNDYRIASHKKGARGNKKLRLELFLKALEEKPGEGYLYSNLGFIGAGAIAGKLLNTTWEKAMEQEVFKPLGIKSVGYGAPEGRKVVRGHFNGQATPTGYEGDNPAIYGPAGGLHLSLNDWALFAQDQLKGHLGNGKLLKPESYQKLHTPVTNQYALGWGVAKNSEGKVVRLAHDGSNTMWHARVIIDLRKKTGICLVANVKSGASSEWFGKITDAAKKDER
ncbi:beta-lactamase family protein [Akkermansiaceae bacterium]|nr:beta-lactamase family protein [Akkermansiaceae bacterium]MDB4537102.1 beta-lactamase family protein [Akkermansiaceae bacterium]